MPVTFKTTVSDTVAARIIAAHLPVDIDINTGEPIMSEAEWAKKRFAEAGIRDALKKEKRKNRPVSVPVDESEYTIE